MRSADRTPQLRKAPPGRSRSERPEKTPECIRIHNRPNRSFARKTSTIALTGTCRSAAGAFAACSETALPRISEGRERPPLFGAHTASKSEAAPSGAKTTSWKSAASAAPQSRLQTPVSAPSAETSRNKRFPPESAMPPQAHARFHRAISSAPRPLIMQQTARPLRFRRPRSIRILRRTLRRPAGGSPAPTALPTRTVPHGRTENRTPSAFSRRVLLFAEKVVYLHPLRGAN